MTRIPFIRLLFLGMAGLAALPAAAQERDARDDEYLLFSPGVGVQFLPTYPGADDMSIGPLFGGHVRREGDPIPFRGPDDGFGISLTGRGGTIEFGPMIQFQGKRDEEDAGALIGDVDFTVEPGLFLNINVTDSLRLRAEARRGIGGHESFLGDLGVDFAIRPDDDTILTIGPRLRLADEDYMETYFGVTPAVSAVTGLAPYDPDGGIRAVGAIASLTHQITRSFGVYAYAGYDRLVGDAADSPIVQVLGSEDQFSAGVALYYTFRMRRPF